MILVFDVYGRDLLFPVAVKRRRPRRQIEHWYMRPVEEKM